MFFKLPLKGFAFFFSEGAAKFKIGDGGHMDNSGLLPALQRKARNLCLVSQMPRKALAV